DKVLSEKADELPTPEGGVFEASWRRATALVELCVTDDPSPAQVTVLVDTAEAARSGAETGVVIEAGPRVGRRVLEAVLCDAVVEVTARSEDGRYMEYGRRHRTVPPWLRRALHHKYHGVCAVDGCNSRHRLQVHHIIPWSQGGRTDQDNLVLLCWYHHHVAIHAQGLQLYTTPQGRIRLKTPETARGP
ncbi:MAG: HNH endonuclease, partial [Actinobacteria bacterium]|nr:HNH endonuclease [Actinomycetota bacterium]